MSPLQKLETPMTGDSPPRTGGVVEPMPEFMATILLRALTWCGDQITQDEREAGWAWVENQRGNVEEMGT